MSGKRLGKASFLATLVTLASTARAQEPAQLAEPALEAAPAPPAAVVAPAPAPAPPSAAPAAPAAPAAVPTAAPAPAAAVPLPTRSVTSPGEAIVHVAVSHRDAWLEMRSSVDGGAFVRACPAPCDARLQVEGREARVVAPGMTTSNIFRFDGGGGVAGVRVDGGSAKARSAGIITLVIGIPVAIAGMALFAQGRMKHSTGLQAGGIAGLSAGGLSIAISLPLLLLGTTHVKDDKGSLIAFGEPHPSSF